MKEAVKDAIVLVVGGTCGCAVGGVVMILWFAWYFKDVYR